MGTVLKFFTFLVINALQLQSIRGGLLKLLDLQSVQFDECKDLRDDCSSIPAKGDAIAKYCEDWKDDIAVKECPKTCGRCKAPFPPQSCEDERDDCSWISSKFKGLELMSYCKLYKDHEPIKQCRKTCGLCKKQPSPPKPEPEKPEPEKPKPKPTPKRPDNQLTGFQKECLVAHNRLRAKHRNTPPLKWSSELTEDAQAWADYLASNNKFMHDPKLKAIQQGENLAYFSPINRMCDGPEDTNCAHCGEFVQDWYNEIKFYDFDKGEGWFVYLHFTQVVWKSTSEVGMATAAGNNRVVAVARYKRPGNQGPNEIFKENVLKPLYEP